MGTYNHDETMLIEEITDFLDALEGDFNRIDLQRALEFMKDYGPTSDSSPRYENKWLKMLWKKRSQKTERSKE